MPTEPIAAELDAAWLRGNVGWPVGPDDPVYCRSINASGLMGAVHLVRCGDRELIFKTLPPGGGDWGAFAAAAGVMHREVCAYHFLAGSFLAGSPVAPRLLWSALHPDGTGALALENLGPPSDLVTAMACG